jgi:hypothetical protein
MGHIWRSPFDQLFFQQPTPRQVRTSAFEKRNITKKMVVMKKREIFLHFFSLPNLRWLSWSFLISESMFGWSTQFTDERKKILIWWRICWRWITNWIIKNNGQKVKLIKFSGVCKIFGPRSAKIYFQHLALRELPINQKIFSSFRRFKNFSRSIVIYA